MGEKQKYVIVYLPGQGFPSPFTFNETIAHGDFMRILKSYYGERIELRSAGTVSTGNFVDGSRISATPGSSTLEIIWSEERQKQDTQIIRRRFGDFD